VSKIPSLFEGGSQVSRVRGEGGGVAWRGGQVTSAPKQGGGTDRGRRRVKLRERERRVERGEGIVKKREDKVGHRQTGTDS
jgi:hypothetical protein